MHCQTRLLCPACWPCARTGRRAPTSRPRNRGLCSPMVLGCQGFYKGSLGLYPYTPDQEGWRALGVRGERGLNSWVPSSRAGVHRFRACRPDTMPAGRAGQCLAWRACQPATVPVAALGSAGTCSQCASLGRCLQALHGAAKDSARVRACCVSHCCCVQGGSSACMRGICCRRAPQSLQDKCATPAWQVPCSPACVMLTCLRCHWQNRVNTKGTCESPYTEQRAEDSASPAMCEWGASSMQSGSVPACKHAARLTWCPRL